MVSKLRQVLKGGSKAKGRDKSSEKIMFISRSHFRCRSARNAHLVPLI